MNHWLIFGLAALLSIVGGTTSYFIHENQSIVRMVKAGSSAAEAKCATSSNNRNSVACLTAALIRSIEGNAK